jgi:citrate lyase subunit beta-like protein
LEGIVIPKVHSAEEVLFVASVIEKYANPDIKDNLIILASIESARAILNLREVRLVYCLAFA